MTDGWISVTFTDIKTRLYRRIKYNLLRPRPPLASAPFDGPVVVVGSAPTSNRPAGFDERFRVITVNGSQMVTAKWGMEKPDITFMMFNQVRGDNTNALEVRRVLKGQRTGALYVLLWREGLHSLREGLQAFDYQYDDLRLIDRYQRMALLDRLCGLKSDELDREYKCSNGIYAALFALYNGARAVILTGISPQANGHVYNQENLPRFHKDMDQKALQALRDRRYPIFTADPDVAELSGIPLWNGEG
ncbi:membrane-anchored protein [Mycoplana sp. BE70]|uniref:membrane-anchored protein n=1 Tax=Mycoplana sp. BE70 TaxID=2817775 RepID=UPI0038620F6A